MSTRIKLPETKITRARAEEILADIVTLTIEERDHKNALDREIASARERYEAPLTRLAKEIQDRTVILESWAAANPSEFPKDRKSISMLHGTIGYRTGTPKLKTLAKWTWDRVLAAIQGLGKPMAGFVRVKEEVNKEALIHSIGQGDLEPALARAIGVQIVQEESFFVEPNVGDQAARSTVETTAA